MVLHKVQKKMSERVTFTFSIRAMAVALVVLTAVFGFLIYGAYQGISANHSGIQANKQAQVTGRAQRIADEAVIKAEATAEIDSFACDVVYYFDSQGVKNAPFIEHLRTGHHCLPVTAHPFPKGKKPVVPATLPAAQAGGPSGSSSSGAGGVQGKAPRPTPSRHPKPSPKPTPHPSPGPSPILRLGPILNSVCKLLNSVVGPCILFK